MSNSALSGTDLLVLLLLITTLLRNVIHRSRVVIVIVAVIVLSLLFILLLFILLLFIRLLFVRLLFVLLILIVRNEVRILIVFFAFPLHSRKLFLFAFLCIILRCTVLIIVRTVLLFQQERKVRWCLPRLSSSRSKTL